MEEANKRTYCGYRECRKTINFLGDYVFDGERYFCDNGCRAMWAYDRACLQFEKEFYSKIR